MSNQVKRFYKWTTAVTIGVIITSLCAFRLLHKADHASLHKSDKDITHIVIRNNTHTKQQNESHMIRTTPHWEVPVPVGYWRSNKTNIRSHKHLRRALTDKTYDDYMDLIHELLRVCEVLDSWPVMRSGTLLGRYNFMYG